MAQEPVIFNESLNLANLGISADSIKFGSCSMESDKFITVCENQGGTTNVVIVDMSNGNSVMRRPIAAEAAIMNPQAKVLALRAGNQLQIFNLELKAKMKSFQIQETVVFWKWTSPNQIALVTPTAVFHWSIEGDSAPAKAFDRHAQLGAGTQIINYHISPDGKWSLLMGISAGGGGVINGAMQLYSNEKNVSQILTGHSGCFAEVTPEGRTDKAQVLVFFEKKPDQPPKLYVMEVGGGNPPFRLPPTNVPVPADGANDFPVSMIPSPKHGIVYMVTKMGYLYMFDVLSGKALYRARVTTETIFCTTYSSESGGLLGITQRTGKVLHVSLNPATLVPFIVSTLRDNALGIAIASRLNLPGADDLYVAEFNRLMSVKDVAGAAKLAAASPNGLLRSPETIQRFQAIEGQPGAPQPVFQYFSVLLEKGKLNAMESMELARPVLQQGRGALLEKWLTEDKLECTEQLGDVIASSGDMNMALSVYLRANVPEKAINCMMQRGEFDKIVQYATQVNYQADYSYMLQSLVRSNPQGALDFAKGLAAGSLVDPAAVVEIFMSVGRIQETTAFLLEVLKENKPEQGFLQTKLLEINLRGGSPQVADAILQNSMFSHYDKPTVAKLCEAAGLTQRALEHYTDIDDIKRAMTAMTANPQNTNPEFITNYFGSLSPEASIECLKDMLARNMRGNLQMVTQIAAKYNDKIGSEQLTAMFDSFKCYEGLFYYLGSLVNFSQDPLIHFKYIEAAAKCQQFKEVERVCRDSTVYEPEPVKQFLMECKLADPRPLIHVCDRHDFIEEMTGYLYNNQLQKYIEVYVQKVSPAKTPLVVGKLLDLDCNEDFIRGLLNSVGIACPVDELVAQVETRNRLRLLQPWLEALIATGNQEASTHNAIGKIYITLNRDPVSFLTNDPYYEPKVLGKFCEKLDPSLAFLAYKRGAGESDDDLIRVTTENGLFKDQARYLVEKQDLELWARVLAVDPDSGEPPPERRQLIDQVVQTALPESKNPDHVSTTVKAFMAADLPSELIELLERIVLQGSDFSQNRNLQNLLILTAIKADKERVMEYINRLDNFDGEQIAGIAISEQYELFEEGYTIYVKFAKMEEKAETVEKLQVSAVGVLADNLRDMQRASEYAERVGNKTVWAKVANAQLTADMVDAAIQSFIKADDAGSYTDVIAAAERNDMYDNLTPYLVMAREHYKEPSLDTMLIYSYARSNKMGDLEEFIGAPNVANIQSIGERCFEEGMYVAARTLFTNINNNSMLSKCFVNLEMYREAIDAAGKANSVSTWKEVNKACVVAGEFRLAGMAGMHIIVHPDHLEELIRLYETQGHSSELITMMEQGLGLEGSHSGVFTELGVLYCKYMPAKLNEHLKIFAKRMNIPKLLRACETSQMWDETVYLYMQDDQFDNAVKVMIEHPICFKHDLFLDCCQKVRNTEIFYKAIAFYIEVQPLQLNKLLNVLASNLDHSRVVHLLRKLDNLPLAMPYLKRVQKEDLSLVNEALNELYMEEEDYDGLRESIDSFGEFDKIALAQKCEKHELLEFRRIAAYLYKKNKRYAQSVQLSKTDKMYKDAIDTAAESNDTGVVSELLKFFVSVQDKECFCATLYTCYDLISPDVALELAWRNGYTDYVMPYVIQYTKHLHEKVALLEKRTAPEPEDNGAASAEAGVAMMGMDGGMLQLGNGDGYATSPMPPMPPQAPGMGMGMGMGGGMPPPQNMGGGNMGMGGGGNMGMY